MNKLNCCELVAVCGGDNFPYSLKYGYWEYGKPSIFVWWKINTYSGDVLVSCGGETPIDFKGGGMSMGCPRDTVLNVTGNLANGISTGVLISHVFKNDR